AFELDGGAQRPIEPVAQRRGLGDARAGVGLALLGLLRAGIAEAAALGYGLYRALRPAIQFESAMADVTKVIDLTADGQRGLSAEILKLSTEVPIAAKGISEIVASLGQAGVVAKDLPEGEQIALFRDLARDAAVMGVAFDVSAKQAGDALATFMAGAGMTRAETLDLANTINFLSNNMNATAGNVLEVVRRNIAIGKTAGLAANETAGLAAALLQSGAAPEIAATAQKNLLNALTRGAAASKRQRDALKELGFGATDLAKRMQVDAASAITDVLDRLRKLDDAERGGVISMLFGEESKSAIAPLITNSESVAKALRLIGDETERPTAMLAEYRARAATTENALQLLGNRMNEVWINIGSSVLPTIVELAEGLGGITEVIADWAAKNPEWMSTILEGLGLVVAGLIGSRVAGYAASSVMLAVQQAQVAFRVAFIAMGAVAGVLGVSIGAVAAAVVSLGVALYALVRYWDQITAAIERAGSAFDKFMKREAERTPGALGPVGLPPLETPPRPPRPGVGRPRIGRGDDFGIIEPPLLPMRATGGPVRAGHLYGINEMGRELFMPGASGSMVTARGLLDAVQGAAGLTLARTGLTRTAGVPAAGGAAPNITVNIAPPAGADARELARIVRREIEEAVRAARQGGLHDGASLA
ncbi:MAG: phage tail tape measure protein, partial [Pseudomonadota bacterium]